MPKRKKTNHNPGQGSLLDYIRGAKGPDRPVPDETPVFEAQAGHSLSWKGPYGWTVPEVPADAGIRFEHNLAALRELKAIRGNGAPLSETGLDRLALYSGFGGISISPEMESALRSVCDPAETGQIRRASLDLPPLSAAIQSSLWACLGKSGLDRKSLVLVPSCGNGSFAATGPVPDLSLCMLEGKETDFGVASLLYPGARVINREFGSLRSLSVFDAITGQLPLSRSGSFDLALPELSRFPMHTHHLLKSLSLLREGGIAALAVPRWFMDGRDELAKKARETAARQAELLAALRVPAGGITNAGAIPVDLLVFKRTANPDPDPRWLQVARTWSSAPVNMLFDENPEFVAGKIVTFDAWRNGFSRKGVNIRTDADELREKLDSLVKRVPANSFAPSGRDAPPLFNPAPDASWFRALPQESAFVHKGRIMIKNFSWLGEESCVDAGIPEKNMERMKSLIRVRDALMELLSAEESDSPRMEALRLELNERYDSHTARFGFLNSDANRELFHADPFFAKMVSLEIPGEGGFAKAPVFFEKSTRTARGSSPRDANDALKASLALYGRVDEGFIARMAPEKERAIDALSFSGRIFRNPDSGEWEEAEYYLSGDIRAKIARAEEEGLSENVAALSRVLPKDVKISDIGFDLGAAWIPGDVYVDFIRHLVPGARTSVRYVPESGDWLIEIETRNFGADSSVYGTSEFPMSRLLPAIIRNRPVIVRDGNGAVDSAATLAARQKAEILKNGFREWVLENADVSKRLEKIYNDAFNTHVPPSHDGSHLLFPGMSRGIELAPHQKNAVWRAVREGRCLFDHAVGTGKTMIAIAAVMETRRMGIFKKPVIIAQQSVLGHWMREFERLYPAARVLLADPDSMSPEKRGATLSRIMDGDYDAVVMAHSSFTSIGQPLDFQIGMLKRERDTLLAALRAHREAGRIGKSDGKIGEAIGNIDALVSAMTRRKMESAEPDFSSLGIDAIFVDESHEFKNLHFKSSMSISGLGNQDGSDKAWDLFLKCRFLQSRNRGRGVFLMTGTPISNSIAEIYTVQRYLDYDGLKGKGVAFFDAWSSVFASVSGDWELDATGTGYKFAQRLSKFRNLEELSAIYRSLADVVTADDLAESELARHIPLMEGNAPGMIVSPRSPEQAEGMERIVERMRNMPADARIDNPLKATSDARKLALDQRLANPDLPDWERSKVNICAENILRIYRDTDADRGVQLVFCDLSTPSGGGFSVYESLKLKLAGTGIPEREIAFAHDAQTPQARQELFARVNEGKIRVLIGSTARMGTGVNVQERAVAAHHLDAPWRQSDLEQRNGRVIRQGNVFHEKDPSFRMKIFYYATENTLDARMWQLLEYKSAAVAQFRKGLLAGRELEDASCAAVTAAEMKAASSGNPLILREIRLKGDIGRLKAIKRGWERDQENIRKSLGNLSGWEERLERAERLHAAAVELAGEKPDSASLDFGGKILSGKEMNEHVKSCARSCLATQDEMEIGKYRGLYLTCFPSRTAHFALRIEAGTEGSYYPRNCEFDMREENLSVSGIFRRVDNFLESGIDAELEKARERAGQEKLELEGLQSKIAKDFPQADELAAKEKEYEKVVAELSGENHLPVMAL